MNLSVCFILAFLVYTAFSAAAVPPLKCSFELRDPVSLPNGGVSKGNLFYEWTNARMLFAYNNGLREYTLFNAGNGLLPTGATSFGSKCTNGNSQTVFCDSPNNCVADCCLTTGICPSSSCVALGSKDSAQSNCAGSCLNEVACVTTVASCNPNQQHCLGLTKCLTDKCDGRTAGQYCVFDGSSKNFKICSTPPKNNPPPSPPSFVGQYQFRWLATGDCSECHLTAWEKSQTPLFKDTSLFTTQTVDGKTVYIPSGTSGVDSVEFGADGFPTKMTVGTKVFTFTGCSNPGSIADSTYTTPSSCTCGKPLDIVLVLDRSCSIDNQAEWSSIQTFVTSLTNSFTYGPTNVNLGITNFHVWTWDGPVTLATGATKSSVTTGAQALNCATTANKDTTQCVYTPDFSLKPPGSAGSCCGCGTSISSGIISGADMLASTINPNLPSIRDSAAKIMIVVTDGFHNKITRKNPDGSLIRKSMKNPDGQTSSMKPQGIPYKEPITGKECDESQGGMSAAAWDDCKKTLNGDIVWSVQSYAKKVVPNLQVFAVGVGEVWSQEQLQLVADNKPNQVFGTRAFDKLSTLVQGIVSLACQSSPETVQCTGCKCGGVCAPCKGCMPPDTCDNNNICTTNTLTGSCCIKDTILPTQCTNTSDKCKTYGCDPNLNNGKGGCTAVAIPVREPTTCQSFTCDPATGNTIAHDTKPTNCTTDAQCNDNNACTTDKCVTNPQPCLNQCVYTPIVCQNPNKCLNNTCSKDTGCGTTEIPLPQPPACTTVRCEPTTGKLIYESVPGSTNCCRNNSDCNDHNDCTADNCRNGGTPQAKCENTDIPCVSTFKCVNATCFPNGGCKNDPIPTKPNTACVIYTYNNDTCKFDGATPDTCNECKTDRDCADKNPNKCKTNVCKSVVVDPVTGNNQTICEETGNVVCNDNDACTEDTCNPLVGCLYTPDPCPDDGNVCTIETCHSDAKSAAEKCSVTNVTCNQTDICHDSSCDPQRGCEVIPIECPSAANCTLSGCEPKSRDGTPLGCYIISSNDQNNLDCGLPPVSVVSAVTGAVVGGVVVAAVGGALLTSGATAPLVFTSGAGAGAAGGAHPNPLYVPQGGEGYNPLQH